MENYILFIAIILLLIFVLGIVFIYLLTNKVNKLEKLISDKIDNSIISSFSQIKDILDSGNRNIEDFIKYTIDYTKNIINNNYENMKEINGNLSKNNILLNHAIDVNAKSIVEIIDKNDAHRNSLNDIMSSNLTELKNILEDGLLRINESLRETIDVE